MDLIVENVDELYEYKNLGVYKNYCGSFNANIDEKTSKKAGMIFSANIDSLQQVHVQTMVKCGLIMVDLGQSWSLTMVGHDMTIN